MAFVARSPKFKSSPQQSPGPAYYQVPTPKINLPAAPFNSTSSKFINQHQNQLSPGPGEYQLTILQKGQKTLQFIDNSHYQVVDIPYESSSFKSKVKRINDKISEMPGPGAYQIQPEQKFVRSISTQESKSKEIVKKLIEISNHQAIPSIPSQDKQFGYQEDQNKQLTQIKNKRFMYSGLNNDNPGPSYYNPEIKSNKGCINWKRQSNLQSNIRSLSSQQSQEEIPTTQKLQLKNIQLNSIKLSSGFASKSERSSLFGKVNTNSITKSSKDKIRLGIISNYDPLDNDYEFIDNSTPGPGYYDISRTDSLFFNQPKINSNSAMRPFGCQEQRFKTSFNEKSIGPGQYQLSKNEIVSTNQNINPPFLTTENRFINNQFDDSNQLCPQTYQPRNTFEDKLIDNLAKGPVGNFGSSTHRFLNLDNQNGTPCPTTYDNSIKQEKSGFCHIFKSKSQRSQIENMEQIPAPGAYNLDYYDIKKIVEVKEEDLDLQIQKAPFGTNETRFYEKNQPQLNEQCPEMKEQWKPEKRLENKKEKISPGFSQTSLRFKYKNNSPIGPGDYQNEMNWMKKTYNIMFQQF